MESLAQDYPVFLLLAITQLNILFMNYTFQLIAIKKKKQFFVINYLKREF